MNNNPALKLAMAKLLPEKIEIDTSLDGSYHDFIWKALHKIWHNGNDLNGSEGDYELYYFGSNTVHWAAFDSTPAQLCEALLRATGKWIE